MSSCSNSYTLALKLTVYDDIESESQSEKNRTCLDVEIISACLLVVVATH